MLLRALVLGTAVATAAIAITRFIVLASNWFQLASRLDGANFKRVTHSGHMF